LGHTTRRFSGQKKLRCAALHCAFVAATLNRYNSNMEGTNMPLIKISILKGRSTSEKKKLLDLVHSSLVEAFKIPYHDRTQRVYEFSKADFEIEDDRSDKYTIIEIVILPGRSVEAKKTLYKLIFSKLKTLGYQDNDALVVLHEPCLDNWGLRGGISAREVDLDFSLDV